ncbi:MAG: DDE-type integrase/transposase/recombinase [Acidobacteriota bacterium]|nr:DDE-type integrase/transposase/recombinase [Acidobacteriota bacterium]
MTSVWPSQNPDSKHGRRIYPNLGRTMVLTGLDQLWMADITYVRLREEFVFRAVILDAFSRRVIGWALDRTLEDNLTVSALKMARRGVQPGLVHHSDRGSASRPLVYPPPFRYPVQRGGKGVLNSGLLGKNPDPRPAPPPTGFITGAAAIASVFVTC